MGVEWRSSTWGQEISLEYGKALRDHGESRGRYRVFGSNGPIGWTSDPLVAGPGVILGRKGAYRGVEYSREPFFVIDTAYYVVPKTSLDMRWLYYAIKHYKLGEVDDGSPIPSTTRAAVYMLDLDVPPSAEQRAIAHILGTLDEKIELNRRMSGTLEAMIRALFKSWVVDFDPVRARTEGRSTGLPKHLDELFPDSFSKTDFGDIPNGWGIADVGSLCSRIAMGPFGSDIKTDNFVQTGVPVIRGMNLTHGFIDDGFVFLTESKADELRNANAFPGDIVITHRGTLGQVGLIPEKSRHPRYVVSQSQLVVSARHGRAGSLYLYLYLTSPAGQHAILANTSQTGVPAISRPVTSVKALRLLTPPPAVLDAFERLVSPFMRKIVLNRWNSDALASLRDALLPKLISGELRVQTAESVIGRAL